MEDAIPTNPRRANTSLLTRESPLSPFGQTGNTKNLGDAPRTPLKELTQHAPCGVG
jgi:hypothetical protein